MLLVNEYRVPFQEGMKVADFLAEFKSDADLFIINGYPAGQDTFLKDGDRCSLLI